MATEATAGMEYKIVRSAMGSFARREKLADMLEQEARCGWELMEKLDNARVRLRRPVACRQHDQALGADPYRTEYGATENTIALRVLAGVAAGIALMATIGIIIAMANAR